MATGNAFVLDAFEMAIQDDAEVIGALAEFERNLIRERTMAGLQAAWARGWKGGRPKLLDTDRKVQMAGQPHRDSTNSIEGICTTLGISGATLYRYLSLSNSAERLR